MNRPDFSARWIRMAPDSNTGSRTIRRIVIHDRRHAGVRTDRQELRLELVAGADVDRLQGIGQPGLLQHDGDLPAVRRGPVIEVDHAACSFGSKRLDLGAAE